MSAARAASTSSIGLPGQFLGECIADTPFVTAAVGALDEYARDVDVTIDLGLTPEAYREERVGLLRSVA